MEVCLDPEGAVRIVPRLGCECKASDGGRGERTHPPSRYQSCKHLPSSHPTRIQGGGLCAGFPAITRVVIERRVGGEVCARLYMRGRCMAMYWIVHGLSTRTRTSAREYIPLIGGQGCEPGGSLPPEVGQCSQSVTHHVTVAGTHPGHSSFCHRDRTGRGGVLQAYGGELPEELEGEVEGEYEAKEEEAVSLSTLTLPHPTRARPRPGNKSPLHSASR